MWNPFKIYDISTYPPVETLILISYVHSKGTTFFYQTGVSYLKFCPIEGVPWWSNEFLFEPGEVRDVNAWQFLPRAYEAV